MFLGVFVCVFVCLFVCPIQIMDITKWISAKPDQT